MSKNAWLNGVAKSTFPIASKLHALFLHFKLDSYSYPKYLGKTGYNMNTHMANHLHEFMPLTALLNKTQGLELEKYLIVNYIARQQSISSLNSEKSKRIYQTWIDELSSKEKFNEQIQIYLDCEFGPSLCDSSRYNSTDDHVRALRTAFLDSAARYCDNDNWVVCLRAAFGACYLLSAFPVLQDKIRSESVIEQMFLKKIQKVKAFTDWWCLTD